MGVAGVGKTQLCTLIKQAARGVRGNRHDLEPVAYLPTYRYIMHRVRTPVYAPLKLLDCAGTFHYNFSSHHMRWLFASTGLVLVILVRADTDLASSCKWYLSPLTVFLRTRPWHLVLNTSAEELTDAHYAQLNKLSPKPRSSWALDINALDGHSGELSEFIDSLIHGS